MLQSTKLIFKISYQITLHEHIPMCT